MWARSVPDGLRRQTSAIDDGLASCVWGIRVSASRRIAEGHWLTGSLAPSLVVISRWFSVCFIFGVEFELGLFVLPCPSCQQPLLSVLLTDFTMRPPPSEHFAVAVAPFPRGVVSARLRIAC